MSTFRTAWPLWHNGTHYPEGADVTGVVSPDALDALLATGTVVEIPDATPLVEDAPAKPTPKKGKA